MTVLDFVDCNGAYLEDNGGLAVAGSLERGNDSGGGSAVLQKCSANDQFVTRFSCTYDGRDGKLLLLGVLEELQSNRLAKVLSSF